ncbi:hypothetical protein WKR88_00690 [Trinickia caryophylli]|uniref:Uncharacterized protein n=1 Tax=Trinickia caryophylli TaxID=28094 RepID=A0A1X7CE15_TRICW|nr:hypothetical protein [Trinickia caryophylli]WQE12888.1 hypothetical protein U0034_05675 [Trinickia caryophylli]GLU30611.1 hypothetical protein Busp01_04530 [Trinickia caryophylli]SME95131.1 hypothetical protein SAMN06295900_101271 [Trinickia caryophylli]
MKKVRQLLLAALIPAALSATAHADVKETAHEAKENIKAAGKKIGEDAREAAHGVASTAKAAGHAVASGARTGYYATKHAVRRAVGKDGPEGETGTTGESK